MTRPIPAEVAAFYNEHVRRDPSNPPTRRVIAALAGISVATAQRWLEVLEAQGRLCYPLRRTRRGEA
jgi:hypothetical protein